MIYWVLAVRDGDEPEKRTRYATEDACWLAYASAVFHGFTVRSWKVEGKERRKNDEQAVNVRV